MKWSEDYATGVQRIDDQHKWFFKMTEDSRASLDKGTGEKTYSLLLDVLDRYAKAHFEFEERCMDEYRCPVAQENRDAHVRFREILYGFRQRYAVSGFDPADARKLIDTIDRWLDDHICLIDVHLKQCVKKP